MDFEHLSNQQVLLELGQRFQAARLNANISRQALAEAAGVTDRTISNLEKGTKSTGLLNIIAVLRALGMLDQLALFLPPPPPRAAQLLANRKTPRQRASRQKTPTPQINDTDSPWQWGEDI